MKVFPCEVRLLSEVRLPPLRRARKQGRHLIACDAGAEIYLPVYSPYLPRA
ncbi:MAG TPA: hypothetical protein VGB76_12685 [Pyrinomonadaceae bacterium]